MIAQFAGWVRFEWTDPFVWKRFASMLLISLLPAAACLALGQGVLALLVMAVGTWPFPLRLSVTESGVTCSWLFVRQTLAFSDLTSVRVMQDPRRWPLFRRTVLALGRRHGAHLLVFAKEQTLTELKHAIQHRQARGDLPTP